MYNEGNELRRISLNNLNNNSNKVRNMLILAFVMLGAYIVLATLVINHMTMDFDTSVRNFVIDHRVSWLNPVIILITKCGNPKSVIAVLIVLALIPASRRLGLETAAGSIVALGIYKIMKYTIRRPRPSSAQWLVMESGFSFPSGHSMNLLVTYGIVIFLIHWYYRDKKFAKPLSIFLGILIACIGLSRVYVGVHYPTDVMGGWLFGGFYLIIYILVFERIKEYADKRHKPGNR